MGIWADVYIGGVAICIGLMAVGVMEAIEGTFFWIFDIKSLVA
jgi:hypothetical protein